MMGYAQALGIIKATFNNRVKTLETQEYKDGFNWAMSGYFIDKTPYYTLSCQVAMGDERSSFDRGAEFALQTISNRGIE